VRDLGGGALEADLGPEVDRQLPGRPARLGELVDRDDAPDAHVDPLEVLDRRHPVWAAGQEPGCSVLVLLCC
jgi:hypothetical protein